MLEEVVIGWREVRWVWQTRQNFVAQCVQLLKHWLCSLRSGIVMEKTWAFCWPLPAAGLQFSVHLIDLLSLLLRCDDFSGIQKAIVGQTHSRPPHNDHDLFLVQGWLWKVLWSFFSIQPLSWLSYKIHFSSRVSIWLRNDLSLLCGPREDDTSKQGFFFFLFAVSSWGTHLSRLFTFPIYFKCIMTIERSTLSSLATSCVVVKGSTLVIALSWSLSTSSDRPLYSSSSRLSSPLQNFFSLHCTVYIHYRFLGQMRCWCCELSQLLYACFELE